ncbi:MAG TPA: DUF2442 domain-containing protein [Longimicrobium sp.]|nr:DUF2442 domain-containing protein [Longimicrobium sp.]
MAELPPLDDAMRARFAAAREADRIADLTEPRARDAYYDPATGRIVVELKLGGAFAFAPEMYSELAGRSPAQLAAVQPAVGGEGLEWEDLDVHIAVAGVLVRMLGPALPRAFAQKGGSSTSEAKAAAARANGARGGRPRKRQEPFRYPQAGALMARETLVAPEDRTPFLPDLPLDEYGMPIPPEPKPRRRGRKKSGE